ncbi:hypothetical protein FIV09_09300 [Roseivivax sp. THAF197b]|nr:hypothetical protein FIV09_09300 [Roseivivax sp. THAF197b]
MKDIASVFSRKNNFLFKELARTLGNPKQKLSYQMENIMDLKIVKLTDQTFALAEVHTNQGVIQIEAEVMSGGLPAEIGSITWKESGEDALLHIANCLDEVRKTISSAANEILG